MYLYSLTSSDSKNKVRINEIIELISKTKSFKIALTHKSYHSIDSSAKSYDTLEFLGDSILDLYVSIFLYKAYPEYTEGKLTTERSLLVEGKNLSSISLKIGLYKYLNLGIDKKNIDFNNKSLNKKDIKILGDIYESFIAALFIEKGEKLLCEFLTLTILDKAEFKDKLAKLNQDFSINKENNIKKDEDKDIKIGNLYRNIEITDNRIKVKLSEYLDKSLNNQEKIIELLTKNNILPPEHPSSDGLMESNYYLKGH